MRATQTPSITEADTRGYRPLNQARASRTPIDICSKYVSSFGESVSSSTISCRLFVKNAYSISLSAEAWRASFLILSRGWVEILTSALVPSLLTTTCVQFAVSYLYTVAPNIFFVNCQIQPPETGGIESRTDLGKENWNLERWGAIASRVPEHFICQFGVSWDSRNSTKFFLWNYKPGPGVIHMKGLSGQNSVGPSFGLEWRIFSALTL